NFGFNRLTATIWSFRIWLVTILRIRLLILSFWYKVHYGSVHTYFHTLNTRTNRLAHGIRCGLVDAMVEPVDCQSC
ncbi:hypothetical protein C0J52_25878, partial [Blattella germanica]